MSSSSRSCPSAGPADSAPQLADHAEEKLEEAIRTIMEVRESDPIGLERSAFHLQNLMGQLYIILCGVRYAAEEAKRAAYYKEHAA